MVLARATALMGPTPDEARALLDGITLALPGAPPEDPFSDAYREWTWELYRTISGRAAYDTAHEASPFDLATALERPFPYQTGSLALVGRDLVARGHLLECLAEAEALARGGAVPAPGKPLRRRVRPGLGQPDGRPGRDGPRRHRGGARREVLPVDRPPLHGARSGGRRARGHARFRAGRAVRRRSVLRELPPLRRPSRHAGPPPRHRATRWRGALRVRADPEDWTTRGGRGSTGFRCGRVAPTAGSSWGSTTPTSTAPSPARGWSGRRHRLGAGPGETDVIVAWRTAGG